MADHGRPQADTQELLFLLGSHACASRLSDFDWSPDGTTIAIADETGSITLMDPHTGAAIHSWKPYGNDPPFVVVAWSPVARLVASFGHNGIVAIWHPSGQLKAAHDFESSPHQRMAWSPDGSRLAVSRSGKLRIFLDTDLAGFEEHEDKYTIAWHPNSRLFAFDTSNDEVHIHDMATGADERLFQADFEVSSIAWSPDGKWLAVGGFTGLVLYEVDANSPPTTIESATGDVTSLQFSPNGHYLAVGGDEIIEIWRRDPWELVTTLITSGRSGHEPRLKFRPDGLALATISSPATHDSDTVRIWGIDSADSSDVSTEESAFYVTVKVALLGEPGVGKTSLAFRMVQGDFQQHPSTHGQRFWVLPELAGTRPDGATCEAVLWDFAGQADYRIVHALLLDDVDVALLVFDPGNTTEPLKGAAYWLRQLNRHTTDHTRSVLVGAKMDRAGMTATRAKLESFCADNKISGGFVETSALTGDGIDVLMDRVRGVIDWDTIRPTITTATFKRVKDFVLRAKAEVKLSRALVQQDELLHQLRKAQPAYEFESRDVAVAVSQLAKHGLVTPLRDPRGVDYVLLSSELLTSLASSIVLEVRRDIMELGTIDEKRLLAGDYALLELTVLRESQRGILLDAAVELFIRHNICFREAIGGTSLLVFPGLINQGMPVSDSIVREEDASFVIKGVSENVYAALVVLLGYTNTLTRKAQWRRQAEYELDPGELCGFQLLREDDGELEIVLYFSPNTPEVSRQFFRAQVERIISRRKVSYLRIEQVRCSCGYVQDRGGVQRRLLEERDFICCGECGKKLQLAGATSAAQVDDRTARSVNVEEREALRRTRYEAALVRLKAALRDREVPAPSCFISYAWGDTAVERRIGTLKDDLANAGITVVFDQVHNAEIGSSIGRFVAGMDDCDYVIVVGSPGYLAKYKSGEHVVSAEMDVIHTRLLAAEDDKKTVLPVLLAGDRQTSFPPPLRSRVNASFVRDEDYFPNLVWLLLTMYRIPADDAVAVEIGKAVAVGALGPYSHGKDAGVRTGRY
jgi:small GTP-binding protein